MLRPTILASLATAGMLATSTPHRVHPALTGTFRLLVTSPRTQATDGLLVLEEAGDQTSGTLLLSESRPAALGNVVVSDTLLTADLKTTDGLATLTLHIAGREVTGEIVRDRLRWAIVGKRTN